MSDNLLEFVLDMKVAGSAASASAIGQVDAAAVAAKRGAEALDRQILSLGRTLETGLKPTRAQALETEFLTGKFRGATEQAYKNAQALTAQVSALEASAVAAKKLALAEEGATKMQADWARQTALGTSASNEATVAYERQNGSLKLLTEAKYADVLADAKRRDAVLLSAKIEQDAIKASEAAIARRASLVKSMPQKLTSFGSAATLGVTLPVAAGAIYASNQAGGFEQNLNLLQAGTGATADMMAKVSAKAIELGRDLQLPATSAQDAARSMLVATQNGLALGDAMEADRGILQLSAAANIDQAESAQLVARTLNSFKMAGGEATKVADLFAASQTKAGVSAENLNSGLSQSSASFSSAHQDLGMLVTELDLLNRANITGEESGTGLKQAMLKLQVPTKDSKAILSELKVSLYDASGQMRPFNEFVNDMGHALEGTTQKERDFVIGKVFGARALRVMNVLLNEGADGYQKMHDKVTQAGVASDIAAARMKGLRGSEEALKSASETLALEVGTHWLPTETAAIRGTAEWINNLDKINPALGMFAGVTIGVASTVGPLALTIAGAVTQYRNLKNIVDLTKTSKDILKVSTAALTVAESVNAGASGIAAAGETSVGVAAVGAGVGINTMTADLTALNLALDATAVNSVAARGGLATLGATKLGIGGAGGAAATLGFAGGVAAIAAIPGALYLHYGLKHHQGELNAANIGESASGLMLANALAARADSDIRGGAKEVRKSLDSFSDNNLRSKYLSFLEPRLQEKGEVLTDDWRIVGQKQAQEEARRKAASDAANQRYSQEQQQKESDAIYKKRYGIDALMDGSSKSRPSAIYKKLEEYAGLQGFTVTSAMDGTHNAGSLHALGRAIDVRTSDKNATQIADFMEDALSRGIRVLDERRRLPGEKVWSGPHLHLEVPQGKSFGAGGMVKDDFKTPAVLGAQQDALVDTYRNYVKTIDALTEIDENRKHKPVYSLSHLPQFNSPSGKPTPIGHDFFAEDQQAKVAALADDMFEQMTQIDEIAKRNGGRGVPVWQTAGSDIKDITNSAGYQAVQDAKLKIDQLTMSWQDYEREMLRLKGVDPATIEKVIGLEAIEKAAEKFKTLKTEISDSLYTAASGIVDSLGHPKTRDTSGLRADKQSTEIALANLDRSFATGLINKDTQAAFAHDRKMLTDHLHQIEGGLKKHSDIVGGILGKIGSSVSHMLTDIGKQQVDKVIKKATDKLADQIAHWLDPHGAAAASGKPQTVTTQKVQNSNIVTMNVKTLNAASSGQSGGGVNSATFGIGGFWGDLFDAGLNAYGGGGFGGGGGATSGGAGDLPPVGRPAARPVSSGAAQAGVASVQPAVVHNETHNWTVTPEAAAAMQNNEHVVIRRGKDKAKRRKSQGRA
jgi:TP901 family phage tail tape measure protein